MLDPPGLPQRFGASQVKYMADEGESLGGRERLQRPTVKLQRLLTNAGGWWSVNGYGCSTTSGQ